MEGKEIQGLDHVTKCLEIIQVSQTLKLKSLFIPPLEVEPETAVDGKEDDHSVWIFLHHSPPHKVCKLKYSPLLVCEYPSSAD